jgi:hypothetical protein
LLKRFVLVRSLYSSTATAQLIYSTTFWSQELGLPISDKAIEQMQANLELDEEQFKIAAVEEKKRRRECLCDITLG